MEVVYILNYQTYECFQTFSSKLFSVLKHWQYLILNILNKLRQCNFCSSSNVKTNFFVTYFDMYSVKMKSGILDNNSYIILTHVTPYDLWL